MIPLAEKESLLAQLTQRLKEEYATLLAAQRATVEGATHEEAKPENDKDTRALEQTYLARGQAERVVQLKADLGKLEQLKVRFYTEETSVGLTALVALEDDDEERRLYILVPAGAGEELASSAGAIKVVTPTSPLGRALMGARLDEDVEVMTPKGKRTLSVVSLC